MEQMGQSTQSAAFTVQNTLPFNINGPETPEHINHTRKSDYFVPDTGIVPILHLSLVVVMLYYCIRSPLALVYKQDAEGEISYVVLLLLFTCIQCFDVYVQVHALTMYKEKLVTPELIWNTYLKTYFVPDMLGLLPLDGIAFLASGGANTDLFVGLTQLRLFTFFRIDRLFQVTTFPKRITVWYVTFFYRMVPVIRMAIWAIVISHWLTIGRLLIIARRPKEAPISLFTNKPMYVFEEEPSYSDSLYFVIYSLTTVGYGDLPTATDGEKIYATILAVIGTITNGLVIGKLTSILQQADLTSERQRKMTQTLDLLKTFEVPLELKEEVLEFQEYALTSKIGDSMGDVLSGLPTQMRSHIVLYIRLRFVRSVSMFAGASHDCQVALAHCLNSSAVAPGTNIIEVGQPGLEMYFMAHGFADVVLPNGLCVATLKRGTFFGEMALLTDGPRMATIRSISFCELLELKKNDFLRILDEDDDFNEQIQIEIMSRVKKPVEKKEEKKEEKKDEDTQSNTSTVRSAKSKSNSMRRPRSSVKKEDDGKDDSGNDKEMEESPEESNMMENSDRSGKRSGDLSGTDGESGGNEGGDAGGGDGESSATAENLVKKLSLRLDQRRNSLQQLRRESQNQQPEADEGAKRPQSALRRPSLQPKGRLRWDDVDKTAESGPMDLRGDMSDVTSTSAALPSPAFQGGAPGSTTATGNEFDPGSRSSIFAPARTRSLSISGTAPLNYDIVVRQVSAPCCAMREKLLRTKIELEAMLAAADVQSLKQHLPNEVPPRVSGASDGSSNSDDDDLKPAFSETLPMSIPR